MRLSAIAKLGYYPTPLSQVQLIATWLRLLPVSEQETVRVLDPCAGTGEALNDLANLVTAKNGAIQTFGIEISPSRAQAAEEKLGKVLNTAFENTILTEETFSLVYLNPPYEGETMTGGGKRQEYTFLKRATPLLVRGGTLVYIIQEGRVSPDVARHLAGWYENLQCARFAPEEYQAFGQVVIFGTRRHSFKQPGKKDIRAVQVWSEGKIVTGYETSEDANGNAEDREVTQTLPDLGKGSHTYPVPPAPKRGRGGQAFRFKYVAVSDEDFERAAERTAAVLESQRDWLNLMPSLEPNRITPAMRPKLGHISMLVSGGIMGTNLVADADGNPLLIKGGTEKYKVRADSDDEYVVEDESEGAEERRSLYRVRVEERARPVLHTVDAAGQFVLYTDPGEISAILQDHVPALAEKLEKSNVPVYDYDPKPWEMETLAPLSLGRRMPGLAPGFTPFQKHLITAIGRLLPALGAAFLNVEMGGGKTGMALGVAEHLRGRYLKNNSSKSPYPALVLGPGIVTGEQNWPKEVREVIPGAVAKVIDTAARPLPKPARVRQWLKSKGIHLDEQAFEGLGAEAAYLGILEHAKGVQLAEDEREALQATLLRAARRPPKLRKNASAANLLDARIGGYKWLGTGAMLLDENHARTVRRKYSLVQFLDDYKTGRLPEKSFAIMSYETAKLASGRVPAMQTRIVNWQSGERGRRKIAKVCTCPRCGAVAAREHDDEGNPIYEESVRPGKSAKLFVAEKRRYCQAVETVRVWDAEESKHVFERRTCGSPLFQNTSIRRDAAARYIQRKARGAFPLLIVDEIHESKAKGTGNGAALTLLANAARHTLGLTGTLFGGYSTSIFWLMYRLSAQVRTEFDFHGELAWAKQFGILRETYYTEHPERVSEDGSYTGAKYRSRVDERPGILPSIIRYGLPQIVFASLPDMGLPLPEYDEEVVWLDLTAPMGEQYHAQADGSISRAGGTLFDWAINRTKNGDHGAISVWLNTALNRVNAMFREETVTYNQRVSGRGRTAVRQRVDVMQLPPVEQRSPKLLWLAERCLAERQEGRKCIVFVRQTGKRNIQPHLQEYLQSQGLRVATMKSTISPRRRMDWIQKKAPQLDVLLTNARLVKVGLNLRMFNTGIFYEIEWSLYTLWQALRRLMRPGAQKDVRMVFPAYTGTLEEHALNLIGEKMKAASLFYGDEVASALTSEGEDDFLRELVRSVLADRQVERATAIFGNPAGAAAAAESVFGSSVAASPAAESDLTWEEWLQLQGAAAYGVGRRSSRRTHVPAGQASLF